MPSFNRDQPIPALPKGTRAPALASRDQEPRTPTQRSGGNSDGVPECVAKENPARRAPETLAGPGERVSTAWSRSSAYERLYWGTWRKDDLTGFSPRRRLPLGRPHHLTCGSHLLIRCVLRGFPAFGRGTSLGSAQAKRNETASGRIIARHRGNNTARYGRASPCRDWARIGSRPRSICTCQASLVPRGVGTHHIMILRWKNRELGVHSLQ